MSISVPTVLLTVAIAMGSVGRGGVTGRTGPDVAAGAPSASDISFTTVHSVDRHPATAWAVYTDRSKLEDWVTGFRSMDSLSGMEGTLGFTSVMEVVRDGEPVRVEHEVVTIRERRQFSFVLRHDVFTQHVDVRFSELEGEAEGANGLQAMGRTGTRVEVTTRIDPANVFYGMYFRVRKGAMRRDAEAMYERLMDVIDDAPASPVGVWEASDEVGAIHRLFLLSSGEAAWHIEGVDGDIRIPGLQFEYNPEASPWTLDLRHFRQGPLTGKVLYGIVRFENDQKMQYDADAGDPGQSEVRPDDFSGSTMIYRRVE